MNESNFQFVQLPNSDKKLFVESQIDKIFKEIECSDGVISLWQAECLNDAIESLATGYYVLALKNIESYSLHPSKLSNQNKCKNNADEIEFDRLINRFKVVKGYPARKSLNI